MTIKEFLDNDVKKLEEIIEQHPKQIPVSVVAELLGCSLESVRTMCEENHVFGEGWRKSGKLNKGFCIPTALFVRWYTKGIYIGNSEKGA